MGITESQQRRTVKFQFDIPSQVRRLPGILEKVLSAHIRNGQGSLNSLIKVRSTQPQNAKIR